MNFSSHLGHGELYSSFILADKSFLQVGKLEVENETHLGRCQILRKPPSEI